MDWTTKLDHLPPEASEMHIAWFLPKNWPGKGNGVSLLIPECELQLCFPTGNVVINRPKKNKNVKYWIRFACSQAIEMGASVFFTCDTSQQLEKAVLISSRLLSGYERVALERVYDPKSRVKQSLS